MKCDPQPSHPSNLPEILAPCGNKEMALAAIHNGASSIYIGTPGFNARGRTKDHSEEELKEIIDLCHLYGVKVLMALNILIFEQELHVIKQMLPQWIALGPDAFIVQDIGLVKLIKTLAPDMKVHASTQMTLTSAESIKLVEPLDMSRYVLAREMSLKEIANVKENTDKELEVFVHGALCVSYSGQCLTSESFGGRSANRGQCAQSCRLDYDLYVDDKLTDLENDVRYFFSPKDLCGLDEVPQLADIGIHTLKIEGRLKGSTYVAAAVNSYKSKIEGIDFNRDNVENTYSRGFYSGWLNGVDHQQLVDGVNSAHVGQLLGRVEMNIGQSLKVKIDVVPQKGDGLLLRSPDHFDEVAGKLWEIEAKDDHYIISFSNTLDLGLVQKGWYLWRNRSETHQKELTNSFNNRENFKRITAHLEVNELEDSIEFIFEDDDQNKVSHVLGDLQEAKNKAFDMEQAAKAFGGLSQTPFELGCVQFNVTSNLFFRDSDLRKVKQLLVDELISNRTQLEKIQFSENAFDFPTKVNNETSTSTKLKVLVRNEAQIDALTGLNIDTVYMDFEFGKDYKIGQQKIKDLGFKVGICTLRIHKPHENHHLKVIEYLKPDSVLVRNLGTLHLLKDSGFELIGDHGLNITNSIAADWFLNNNLDSLSPSYDLNKEQLFDLLEQFGGSNFECNLHHYMPTFHMEHCVFAAFMSTGSSYKDCGKPCEKHKVEVKDHKGQFHYLGTDQECRNTLYKGSPQSALRLCEELQELGVGSFRIEALNETPDELRNKVLLYQDYLEGKIDLEEAHDEIGVAEKHGVTEGQLFNFTKHVDRKKA
jgi:putative protease